jgi:hypothetical protein
MLVGVNGIRARATERFVANVIDRLVELGSPARRVCEALAAGAAPGAANDVDREGFTYVQCGGVNTRDGPAVNEWDLDPLTTNSQFGGFGSVVKAELKG